MNNQATVLPNVSDFEAGKGSSKTRPKNDRFINVDYRSANGSLVRLGYIALTMENPHHAEIIEGLDGPDGDGCQRAGQEASERGVAALADLFENDIVLSYRSSEKAVPDAKVVKDRQAEREARIAARLGKSA